MNDVGHELGAIRHIVDKPLSSKVAMFNKVASQHNASQLLNPFSNVDGRGSPKPIFSKDEYGKPIAGSMTEMRGQKANIHVCKEMLELCQIIDAEGFTDEDNPDLKIIYFGDLFNIYNYISDKVVGLLLRARKHKLLDFEGEMLFQRRDDEVPIFMMKPIKEIRKLMEAKQEEFRRSVSPAPQPTSVLQDRMKRSVSPNPKKSISKSPSPNRGPKKHIDSIATNAVVEIPPSVSLSDSALPSAKISVVEVTDPAEVQRFLDNLPAGRPKSTPIITHITDPEEVQRFLDNLEKSTDSIDTMSTVSEISNGSSQLGLVLQNEIKDGHLKNPEINIVEPSSPTVDSPAIVNNVIPSINPEEIIEKYNSIVRPDLNEPTTITNPSIEPTNSSDLIAINSGMELRTNSNDMINPEACKSDISVMIVDLVSDKSTESIV